MAPGIAPSSNSKAGTVPAPTRAPEAARIAVPGTSRLTTAKLSQNTTANMIGAAQADFYPRITLSGSLAIQSLQLKDLGNWNARTYGLGPSITLPIFQGGRIRATVRLRREQQQEAAIAFQRAVLQAFQEVDNALIAYHSEQNRRDALRKVVEANRRALMLATQRYQKGVADFLQVLTAQRGLFSSQQQLASSTAQASVNLVQLYKALGGGWETMEPSSTQVASAPHR